MSELSVLQENTSVISSLSLQQRGVPIMPAFPKYGIEPIPMQAIGSTTDRCFKNRRLYPVQLRRYYFGGAGLPIEAAAGVYWVIMTRWVPRLFIIALITTLAGPAYSQTKGENEKAGEARQKKADDEAYQSSLRRIKEPPSVPADPWANAREQSPSQKKSK
jgi:hypothetical protein